jgi:hypothetical protein
MLCVSARFVALLGLRRPEQLEQIYAVAGSSAPVRWGCDNCGGNGPLAAGRYQTRLELQPMMRPHHHWPPSLR